MPRTPPPTSNVQKSARYFWHLELLDEGGLNGGCPSPNRSKLFRILTVFERPDLTILKALVLPLIGTEARHGSGQSGSKISRPAACSGIRVVGAIGLRVYGQFRN